MIDHGDSWLQRWSRRKRAATTSGAARNDPPILPLRREPGADPAPSGLANPDDPPLDERSAGPPPEPPPLPAVEDLTRESDYTPFLHHDVPADVHRRALRKLWTSDPVFGFRDGLTDYNEDYTASGIIEQVIATAYRPGQGYEEATPAAGDDDAAAEPAGGAKPELPVSADTASVDSHPSPAADAPSAGAASDPQLADDLRSLGTLPAASGEEPRS